MLCVEVPLWLNETTFLPLIIIDYKRKGSKNIHLPTVADFKEAAASNPAFEKDDSFNVLESNDQAHCTTHTTTTQERRRRMTEISFATDFGGAGFEQQPQLLLESVEEGRALEQFDDEQRHCRSKETTNEKKQHKKKKKGFLKKSKKSKSNKGIDTSEGSKSSKLQS